MLGEFQLALQLLAECDRPHEEAKVLPLTAVRKT